MPRKLDSATIAHVRATLKKDKVFTLQNLISLLGCSRRTAQTKLAIWKTFTSYNHNSKYYALPEIPQFNRNGLWRHKDISFSQYGNLKDTIIHLVTSSEAGLTGKELGVILGLPPRNFVHHFRNCPGIYREKHGGVYIHFSDQTSRQKQQMQGRLRASTPITKKTISENDAIMILVAMLKHHTVTPRDILTLPEIMNTGISESSLQNFMKSHGLLKKNLDSKL